MFCVWNFQLDLWGLYLNKNCDKSINMEVKLAQISDFDQIWNIYVVCRNDMLAQNIEQWNQNYHSQNLIRSSIEKKGFYVLWVNKDIVGAINLDEEQDGQYAGIN